MTANDVCYESGRAYHPPLRRVLDTKAVSSTFAELLLTHLKSDVNLYSSFIWKYGERLMRYPAKIGEDGTYPSDARIEFLQQIDVIVDDPIVGYAAYIAAETDWAKNITDWKNNTVRQTDREFDSPKGDESTAYLMGHQVHEQMSSARVSPDELAESLTMRSPLQAFLERFGGLFLEVF